MKINILIYSCIIILMMLGCNGTPNLDTKSVDTESVEKEKSNEPGVIDVISKMSSYSNIDIKYIERDHMQYMIVIAPDGVSVTNITKDRIELNYYKSQTPTLY